MQDKPFCISLADDFEVSQGDTVNVACWTSHMQTTSRYSSDLNFWGSSFMLSVLVRLLNKGVFGEDFAPSFYSGLLIQIFLGQYESTKKYDISSYNTGWSELLLFLLLYCESHKVSNCKGYICQTLILTKAIAKARSHMSWLKPKKPILEMMMPFAFICS